LSILYKKLPEHAEKLGEGPTGEAGQTGRPGLDGPVGAPGAPGHIIVIPVCTQCFIFFFLDLFKLSSLY
jgi:hypothetical protein